MEYKEKLLDKLERKFGRYAIPNLMNYIVIGMLVVYVMDMLATPFIGTSISSLLAFSRVGVQRLQLWRLITFVLIPPSASPLFIVFSLYFYWLAGSSLESHWGKYRFNLYYLCGMLGVLASGLITGHATNYYLNLSLFLGFAILHPNAELMLFFVLPVKVKWIAVLDLALVMLSAWQSGLVGWLSLIMSLVNVAIFFGGDLAGVVKNAYRRYKWKQNWK